MKETNFLNSACRHCRYYQPEGRRGGSCQKLGVSVDSNWKACVLASSPFDNALDNLDTTITQLDTTLTNLEEIVQLETAFSLPYKFHSQNKLKSESSQNCDRVVSEKTRK